MTTGPAALSPPLDVICACMTVVDVLATGLDAMPRIGETGLVSGITLATGGDATNQCMALAKLGNRVFLMGRRPQIAAAVEDFLAQHRSS